MNTTLSKIFFRNQRIHQNSIHKNANISKAKKDRNKAHRPFENWPQNWVFQDSYLEVSKKFSGDVNRWKVSLVSILHSQIPTILNIFKKSDFWVIFFQMGSGLSVFEKSKNYLTTSFYNPYLRHTSKAQGVLEKFDPPSTRFPEIIYYYLCDDNPYQV